MGAKHPISIIIFFWFSVNPILHSRCQCCQKTSFFPIFYGKNFATSFANRTYAKLKRHPSTPLRLTRKIDRRTSHVERSRNRLRVKASRRFLHQSCQETLLTTHHFIRSKRLPFSISRSVTRSTRVISCSSR